MSLDQALATLDEEALVAQYAPLVKHVAGRIAMFLPPHLEVDDLIGDGVIGLLEAIKKFEPGRNVQFKTYATARIRGAILDGLRRLDWAPRRLRRQARNVERRMNELCQMNSRLPTPAELAQSLDLPVEELEELMAEINGSFVVSLDDLVHMTEDASFLLGDTLADPGPAIVDEVQHHERASVLAEAVDRLGERERTAISLFYFEGLTNKEVAEVMGVSPARVCFLHARALRKLRDSLNVQRLVEVEAVPA